MSNEKMFAAEEKRHWIRITKACNNRCLFCLDRDSLDGSILTLDEIKDDLRLGRDRGADRAVISGGEASIHPNFIEAVSMASAMGYRWVQTITNGRMFYYKHFLQKAVAAGLKEITFSLHAHEEGMFDLLTGVPGSFRQAIAGLKNALATPGLVVSADIVVNALNAGSLFDIVKFQMGLGVREFDLLFPVPFGNAWLNKERLFFDYKNVMPELAKIFALAKNKKAVIWTNRLPPAILEGSESFIQSPTKMHDEVFGRRAMFLKLLEQGVDLPCFPDRCSLCYAEGLCAEFRRLRQIFSSGAQSTFSLTPENIDQFIDIPEPSVSGVVLDPPTLLAHPSIQCFINEKGRKDKIKFTLIVRELPFQPPKNLPPLTEIEISINRHTAPALLKSGIPSCRNIPVYLAAHNPAKLDMENSEATSLKVFFKHFNAAHGEPAGLVRNVPPCISRSGAFVPLNRILPGISTESGYNLEAAANHFIIFHNYHKSLRCAGCVHFNSCPGLHINYLREFGFSEIPGAVTF